MWGVSLVCLFHNPILVNIVTPFALGLGIHNPCFVAGSFEVALGTRISPFAVWPLGLGLGTRSPCFVVWPFEFGLETCNARSTMMHHSTVFVFQCFVRPGVLIRMPGVGLLNFTLGYSTLGYLTFPFFTLPCPALTCCSYNHNMSNKFVCGVVDELYIYC